MAFECLLVEDAGFSDRLVGEDECALNILFGQDDESGNLYFMLIRLAPLGDCRELSFAITVADENGEPFRNIMDGREAARIIPKACKETVRRHVLSAIYKIIDLNRPKQIYMCSIDIPLPEKAETKYDDICTLAEMIGYRIKKSDVGNGQKFWWMEL